MAIFKTIAHQAKNYPEILPVLGVTALAVVMYATSAMWFCRLVTLPASHPMAKTMCGEQGLYCSRFRYTSCMVSAMHRVGSPCHDEESRPRLAPHMHSPTHPNTHGPPFAYVGAPT